MKKIILLCVFFICMNLQGVSAPVDHSLFSAVLKQHVIRGRVDYRGLKNDPRLEQYLLYLSSVDPYNIKGKNNRLAYWINAYNAFTLQIVCRNYPVNSIKDIGSLFRSVWSKKFIKIFGRIYSLDQIEHRIIRRSFREPRIHFALVCAARSCPPLRNEAYSGDILDKQLNDQGRKFLRDPFLNRFSIKRKQAFLSSIFKFYRKDFPERDGDFLRYIAGFAASDIGRALRKEPGTWEIRYISYDWRLNGR